MTKKQIVLAAASNAAKLKASEALAIACDARVKHGAALALVDVAIAAVDAADAEARNLGYAAYVSQACTDEENRRERLKNRAEFQMKQHFKNG